MLFNKTISALIACGVVGTSSIIPTSSQAISLPESQSETVSRRENSWIANGYSGHASWYGPGLYGNPTANGETLRPGTLTAAHRTLPFGTLVRVTNLRNGRSVVVRINDRGPYIGGRVLDLNKYVASLLGFIDSGVIPVRYTVLR